tara:strand:+ start:149862 stop:150602 length:741 start_codon:yes stop_codon:yes gene_type:complete
MTKEAKYTNSPILEALIEIRVSYGDSFEKFIDTFYENIKESYPIREKLPQSRFSFKVKNDGKPEMQDVREESSLYKFISSDGLDIVQVSEVGVVITRLKPYIGWEYFEKKVESILPVFFDKFKISFVNRCGLRFINKIFVKANEMGKMFTMLPSITASKHTVFISNSRNQVQIYCPEVDLTALVAQNIQPGKSDDDLEITLDFDIIKVMNFEPKYNLVSPLLKPMRKLKNDLFESNLKNDLKKRFE